MIDLGDGKPDVDGNGDHAQPTARIHQFDIFGRVGKQDREAISMLETGLLSPVASLFTRS